ncbi:MAG: glutamate--cysteine ligase [Deltaproteobacteria bacterium]|nr:glutamate--cysteine ligase [Deltaproteobacteria bacterium]MBW2394425.1 glutamate--cysteine ligase [Deltaproteobacteria bacterium]
MGLEINRETFTDDEYERFSERLDHSLGVLERLLARPGFGEGEASIGAELEVSLVDEAGRPLPLNQDVLAESVDPRLTVELNRFNLESNLRHGPLAGRPFAFLEEEMRDSLGEIERAAALHQAQVAMIGILPTLTEADLASDAMTEAARFRALSTSLRRLRREPFLLQIRGEDELELRCHDVTYEGAATSLQLHLRVAPSDFGAIYNAVQLTTPLVLAASGNSPTFLGRRLWDETRVALFKQAVDHRRERGRDGEPARVSFGSAWIGSAFELFEENVRRHAVLLPVLGNEDPEAALAAGRMPALPELRLHQGTVWRWNRAIFDPADGGHLRIEMRVLPAGPTIVDMLANSAFQIGLALALAPDIAAWTQHLSFEEVHHDFYRAARDGLAAHLSWPAEPGAPGRSRSAQMLLESLLPKAQQGLDAAGVERSDSSRWLEIFDRRVRSGQTGAAWQRRALAAAGTTMPRNEALAHMFRCYRRHSEDSQPVASWPESSL